MTGPRTHASDGRGLSRPKQLLALLFGVALVWGVAIGVSVLDDTTTDEWNVSGGSNVTFNASDGPTVDLAPGTDLTVDRRHPIPGDGSVDLRPEIGVEGSSGTELRYVGDDNGLVRVDNLSVAGSDAATLVHETAPDATIQGSAEAFEWRDPDLGSNATDIRYRDGAIDVDLDIDEAVAVVDVDTGDIIDTAGPSSGTVSISLPSQGSDWRGISLLASQGAPDIDRTSASPTGPQDAPTDTLSVNVSDPDGTTVSVDFEHNGESVGSDSVDGSGTASTSTGETVMGSNEWTVTATDELGQTTTETFSFESPGELRVFDESNPTELVTGDDVEIEVTFFGEDEVISRSTTTGIVSLDGLPVDQEMTIQAEAANFTTRQTVIRSIYQQQAVYLLPDDAETVTSRFTIDDPTGQFDQGNSRVIVQKPITRDNETTWEAIVADELGSSGFSTVLERDQRYKIEVEDMGSGRTREVGPYVATTSENVVLEVDQLSYQFEDEEVGYRWGAAFVDEGNGNAAIDFGFNANLSVETLTVDITERGGNETTILAETFSADEVQERAIIPDSIEEPNASTYVVEWEATLTDENGELIEVQGSATVGPDRTILSPDGVDETVLNVVAIFIVLMVAGLFSAANVEVGGVVTSLTAGVFWFVGFLPGSVSGMMIALALLVSVMWMVRRARGPQ